MTSEPALVKMTAAEPYRDQLEYFGDELEKLDGLLALRALEADPAAARAAIESATAAVERLQEGVDQRIESSGQAGRLPPLPWLRRTFGLSPFEQQTLLVCLAPELDLKYAAAYGEAQKGGRPGMPTVALVLHLLCRSGAERWQARPLLDPGAPLLRWRFVERSQENTGSGLGNVLSIDPGLFRFLCGTPMPDPRLVDCATLEPPAQARPRDPVAPGPTSFPAPAWAELSRMMRGYARWTDRPRRAVVFHLTREGRGGVLDNVRRVCRELGCPLLHLDTAVLDHKDPELELLLTLAVRDSILWQAPLLLRGLDGLPDDRSAALALRTLRVAERFGWLVLLDGGPPLPAKQRGPAVVWHGIEVPASDQVTRAAHWQQALQPLVGPEAESFSSELACRFRFEAEQIRETVDLLGMQTLGGEAPVTLADCYRACRAQAAPRLGEMGRLFAPRYTWSDLVLPAHQREQLEGVCQSVRHHQAVFGGWGFDHVIHHGRAVSALLVGPPGTGKTMAVEIIAATLDLDVCKVDLSGVVSKYIGETEQRLAQMFREAWAANAVLFFDEADALFGRRTEIADAHDRYANIETSYLLQRIEEYEGIVILASNLRDNLDEAFTRRLRFIVEFPSPDEAARLEIWERQLPASAPRDPDVDLRVLAKHYVISGGSIRNIALRAALLAAQHGTAIRMQDLLAASREEFEKLGKSWVPR